MTEPPLLKTETSPDFPFPTMAVILVGVTIVNEFAGIPPNLTSVTADKFLPVMFIDVPLIPVVGEKEIIVGNMINPGWEDSPPIDFILIFPDSPLPITAFMAVEDITLNEAAGTSPKLTALTPKKLAPEICTSSPCFAEVGEKVAIEGGGINVNPPIVAVPYGVVTLILPLCDPMSTTASIVVVDNTLNL